MRQLPAEIFKAYDIRGIVDKSLTADVVRRIGHALGSLALEQGQAAIAVGVAVQTAEVWYLRWIVYPEWKAMKEQQGATPMQSLAKVGAA